MKTAFLFPGQASQKVGMGQDLFQETNMGRRFYTRANEILGTDIQTVTFEGPEERLKQTRFTQPAIYIVSVILGSLLLEAGVTPEGAAGHSLGEYSALTVAGAFNFETGLRLVNTRATVMQSAGEESPGTMAAIIGLENNTVENLCQESGEAGIVIPANYNAPGQIVISGETDAVRIAMMKAKDKGARMVVELQVGGAFHSPLMSPAREALAEMLNSIEIQDVSFPVYTNISGLPLIRGTDIRDALIRQLENPVLWNETIVNMREDGFHSFVEVGPGKVLQGLNRRIDRTLSSDGVETLIELQGFTNV